MSDTINQAYKEVLEKQAAGWDEERIYVHLAKMGFSEDLCQQVVRDVLEESKNNEKKELLPKFYLHAAVVCIGLAASVLFFLIYPKIILLPLGTLIGSLVYAVLIWNKLRK